MNKFKKEDIINQYETSCKIIYEATYTGDYRTNNKEGDKLLKIFKMFEKMLILRWNA